MSGEKARQRAESFGDHFSQAGLFFRGMSKPEREHIIMALQFELGKLEREEVRKRVIEQILAKIDAELVTEVAQGLGMSVPTMTAVKGRLEKVADTLGLPFIDKSPALSQENQKKDSSTGPVTTRTSSRAERPRAGAAGASSTPPRRLSA